MTKTFPATDVLALVRLGVADIGENRDQEAAGKVAELAELAERADVEVRWHFVGRLQTNKCASVASYAFAVHSVDRLPVVTALADAAVRRTRALEVFVQVSLDGDPARGGAPDAQVPALADAVAAAPGLRLAGVMAVAPRDEDPQAAFARLASVAARLRADHPAATAISAGMSGDLEAAIAAGATHVRVGTALLGGRAAEVG